VYLIAPGGSALLVTPDGSLGIQTHPLTHLSASRRDALSVCLPLGARPATEVEQTPDGSLGTHKPPSHLSVPEGRSFFNDNKDNKNNSLSATRTEPGCRIIILTRIITNYPLIKKIKRNYDL